MPLTAYLSRQPTPIVLGCDNGVRVWWDQVFARWVRSERAARAPWNGVAAARVSGPSLTNWDSMVDGSLVRMLVADDHPAIAIGSGAAGAEAVRQGLMQ